MNRTVSDPSTPSSKETAVIDLYVGLTDHSGVQILLFTLTVLLGGWFCFHFLLLPALHWFFHQTLEATIVYGDSLWSRYTNWEVILEQEGGGETHYFFNPLLSFLPFIVLVGFAIAFFVTTLLPPKIGFMRQKIRREVINMLDRVVRVLGLHHQDNAHTALEQQLLQMDLRSLHAFAVHNGMPFNDLEDLQKALRWEHQPVWKKVLRINDAIRLYMRSYFTVEYGNQMLGFVYIGAAVLIILIGLRGLKFIPPTKPSVIIFALFLEFVLLLLYAITVIYTRSEDEERSWGTTPEPSRNAAQLPESETEQMRAQARQLLETFLLNSPRRQQ